MKQTAKLLLGLLACIVLLAGCGTKQETFVCKDLSVQLPQGYMDLLEETDNADADFLLGHNKVIIQGIAEDKAALLKLDSGWTLDRYGRYILQANGLSCLLEDKNGSYRFTYEAPVDGMTYTYTGVIWEGDAHYWVVQSYCPTEVFADKQQEILKILDSIS